jgi:hypothetical protein
MIIPVVNMTLSMNKKLAEEKIKLIPDGFLLPAAILIMANY